MNDRSLEAWADIKGYEGSYQISSHGRVRSLARVVPHPRGDLHLKGRILKSGLASHGYLTVALLKNGKQKTHSVHVLVATEYVANLNNFPIANHKDGDKTNNHYTNFVWCTYSQNTQHAYDIGLYPGQGKGGKLCLRL